MGNDMNRYSGIGTGEARGMSDAEGHHNAEENRKRAETRFPLRNTFAAAALSGIIARGEITEVQNIVSAAFIYADTMLLHVDYGTWPEWTTGA